MISNSHVICACRNAVTSFLPNSSVLCSSGDKNTAVGRPLETGRDAYILEPQ